MYHLSLSSLDRQATVVDQSEHAWLWATSKLHERRNHQGNFDCMIMTCMNLMTCQLPNSCLPAELCSYAVSVHFYGLWHGMLYMFLAIPGDYERERCGGE
jgi:hypothetical protein